MGKRVVKNYPSPRLMLLTKRRKKQLENLLQTVLMLDTKMKNWKSQLT